MKHENKAYFLLMLTVRAFQMSGMTSFSLFIVTSFGDVVAAMTWIELCATRKSHSAVPLIMFT